MEKLKRILAACCCCFLMTQLWSGSCTAEAAGEKKLIRKELHDIKYTRAYGSHVITEYTYNEAGQKIKWTVSTAWDNEPEIETFYAEYNADGTLKREYSDLGYSAIYEYYSNGQLRSRSAVNEKGSLDGIKHYDPYGIRMDAEPWAPYVTSRDEPIAGNPEDRRYKYDDAGRIVLFEVRVGLTGEPKSYEYSYDEQGRIAHVSVSNSFLNSIDFQYMSGGGYIIRWKQENADFSRTWEEEYNENNQIVRYRCTDLPYDYGINYAYDTEGNLIVESRWGEGPMFALGDTKYEYEYGNGVKTVIQDSETSRKNKTEYQYDQDGDLVKISKYECDENGNFEATPYCTEVYIYEGADSIPGGTTTENAREVDLSAFKTVGNVVTFGNYEQDNNSSNGKEEIEWIVLANEGNKSLLISRYALDWQQYNTEYADITWETCPLRSWLNNAFLNAAFTSDEQKAILSTSVDNSKSQGNSDYSTSGGNNTTDQIFLLSYAEVEKYFNSDSARSCKRTAYAKAQGDYMINISTCYWWLRSPGYSQNSVAIVGEDGALDIMLFRPAHYFDAVRPALWINLES